MKWTAKEFLAWRCPARHCPNYGGVLDNCPVLAGYGKAKP